MAQLAVVSLRGRHYHVSGGRAAHAVTWGKRPTCDCPDFAYRGQQRPCKHLRAVAAFRDAEPLAHVIFPKTPEEVLDLLGPSWDDVKGQPARPARAVVPSDRRVAVLTLEAWAGELRAKKRRTTTLDGLWAAACCAVQGLECERTAPSSAAEFFADAAAIVRSKAAA